MLTNKNKERLNIPIGGFYLNLNGIVCEEDAEEQTRRVLPDLKDNTGQQTGRVLPDLTGEDNTEQQTRAQEAKHNTRGEQCK